MRYNLILDTDFYKTTHRPMYPKGTTGLYSYAESRGGEYPTGVFFGPQAFIKERLLIPVTHYDIEEAKDITTAMGVPFDAEPWNIIRNDYGGYLPLTIKAVKEGSKIPYKNALVSVENNDARLAFLTSYIETALIRLWYPTTIASKAYAMRQGIERMYERYADTTASADFALLDFGARGVSSYESSEIGTAAFLTSFIGTDSIPGVRYVKQYYGGKVTGFSVKATEHSIMCSYGKEGEKESFRRLVTEVAQPDEIISVVSDTWDIYQACHYWNSLSSVVKERGVQLVIRPDSGEPTDVLPKMLEILSMGYETHLNDKGLRVFDNLKLLWGDGVSEENYLVILGILPKLGYGVENLMLGSGGGLLQNVNRDTMKFAFKASAVQIDGRWIPISKNPVTDPGKKSKHGRVTLVQDKDGNYHNPDESIARQIGTPLFETIYHNGELIRDQTMDEIRELVRA